MGMSVLMQVQEDVYGIVSAAAAALPDPLPVFDHAPTDPPASYVRIDAFHFHGDMLKNCERGKHSFMVHVFVTPRTENNHSRGIRAAKEPMVAIHTALKAGSVQGQKVFHHEYEDNKDQDGVTVHAHSRYSVVI